MKTKAAVAFGESQALEIVELDLRDPEAHEVTVRLHATGLCHSDIAALDGENVLGAFPIVLGHEGAGVVEKVGAAVTSVVPGDHVMIAPLPQCGRCEEFKEKPASTVVATSGSTFFGKSGGKQSGPRGSGRSSGRAPKISTPRKMV